jgi:glycosyltransferase involved in cell wall biosynthesis
MTLPLTVAIPFFNEARSLRTAIQSILRQTFREFELLLIDDGSTDGSLEIARSFCTDPRVVLLADGRRKHLPARLNEVVRRARGRIVARMDADDLSHPERLMREMSLLEERPNVAAVGTWTVLLDEADRILCVSEAGRARSRRDALHRGVLPHATMLARRSWLEKYPYDERLTCAEDRDLWCRTVEDSELAVIPDVLYAIRIDTTTERFVRSYAESQRQNRALFLRYGPASEGWPRTLRACAASHGKTAMMRVATALGAARLLVERRGRPPTSEERNRAREIIAAASR